MNALHEAKERIQNAYYDERGMAEVMRQEAAIYAAIAQVEQLTRIADALEAKTPEPDPRAPGQSWEEYHLENGVPLRDPLHTAAEPPSPLDNF